jgi:predicted nucleic acid-binding protein
MTQSTSLARGTKVLWGDGGAGAVAATLSHGSSAANLTLTANAAGTGGNAITLAIVNPGGTAALSVSVSTNAITVNARTVSGDIASTANDIIAAIFASTAARALVTPSSSGTGTGVVTALTATALSGGTNSAEVFHEIANLGDISVNEGEEEEIDTTSHSTVGETLETMSGGFRSAASISFPLNFKPNDASHAALRADFSLKARRNGKLVPPVSSALPTQTFVGQIKSLPRTFPVKGVIGASVVISLTAGLQTEA